MTNTHESRQATIDHMLRSANLFCAAMFFVEDPEAMDAYDKGDDTWQTEFVDAHLRQVGIDLSSASDELFDAHLDGFIDLVEWIDNLDFDLRQEYRI